MRRNAFVVVVVVLVLTVFGFAGSALASNWCVGSENTVVACADPTGNVIYQDCVWLPGDDHCTWVFVYGPDADVRCGDRNIILNC